MSIVNRWLHATLWTCSRLRSSRYLPAIWYKQATLITHFLENAVYIYLQHEIVWLFYKFTGLDQPIKTSHHAILAVKQPESCWPHTMVECCNQPSRLLELTNQSCKFTTIGPYNYLKLKANLLRLEPSFRNLFVTWALVISK